MTESPIISLDFRHGRIRVHKVTLKLLGEPSNILLLVNPDSKTICITVGSPDDASSHRIASQKQKNHSYYELHSKSLLETLEQCWTWNKQANYRITGRLSAQSQMALFKLEDSVCITNDA